MTKFILFCLLFLPVFIILTTNVAFSHIVKNGPRYSSEQTKFMHSLNETGNKRTMYPQLINATIDFEKKHGGIHKKTVIKDLKIELNDKNFRPLPFIPVGTFNGKLKQTGNIKIVFGISGEHLGNLVETLGNIHFILRYTKLHHEKHKISVVFYGAMAHVIMTLPASVYNAMESYSKKGVKFYVCYNALMINGFVASNLPYYIKTVPMGTLKIYVLRKEGYMYFTNP